MITAWMLQSLVIGALLGVAALCADELLRLARLPRRGVWASAAAAAVLLPLLSLTGGAGQEPLPASGGYVVTETSGAIPDVATGPSAVVQLLGTASSWLGDASAAAIGAIGGHSHAAVVDSVLVGGWLAFSTVLLALLAWTGVRFTRSRRGWKPAVLDGMRVYITHDVGPAVVGLIRPCIVVPGWLAHGSAERRRLILLHEREHVRRRDHTLLATAAVLGALLPWNLPLHWLLRRLRLAIELDCDRRVLAAGAPARAYGSLLIDIAARTHSLPVAAAALADTPTDLERRIVAMTNTTRTRFTPLRAAAAAFMAVALVLVACDVDLMDPSLQDATVGEAVDARITEEPAVAVLADNARYILDGREVTLAEVREVEVSDIAHVEVIRGSASAAGRAEVRLTTKDAAAAEGAPARAEYVATLRPGAEAELAPARAGDPATARRARVRMMRDGAIDTTTPQELEPAREIRMRALQASQEGEPARELRVQPVPYSPSRTGDRPQDAQPLGAPVPGAPVRGDGIMTLRAATAVDGPQPLYVVDGVIISPSAVDRVMTRLQPDDIESVEVIKGEVAARLYGARGGNGVIRITTRR